MRLTKNRKQILKYACEELVPFNRLLGIRLQEAKRGCVTLALPFKKEFIGDWMRPAIHGGVISALADAAGGAAVWTELNHDDRISTVDLLVDYLTPAGRGEIRAVAKVIRIGNRVAVTSITVLQEGKSEPIAQGRAVYNIARGM